jgi:ATP-dependent RNA circularization protein (DNA/RNA ligase family)
MLGENMTAEDIFMMIDNQSVSKNDGIKLIENYGIQQQKKSIEENQNGSGKIVEIIEKLNNQLDEMLKTVIGAEN